MSRRCATAATSINATRPPAIFRLVAALDGFGAVNLDYGGGKYDSAQAFLGERCLNLVYDPCNRSSDHNRLVRTLARQAATATISNVFNVLAAEAERRRALAEAFRMITRGGTVYLTVYEGDRSGLGRQTAAGYQNNAPLAFYAGEISRWGYQVHRIGRLLCVRRGRRR